MEKINLCEHLSVPAPDTSKNGDPAPIRCFKCKREFSWDREKKAYVCYFERPVEQEKLKNKEFRVKKDKKQSKNG